jgi:hypothetical protein
LPGTAAIGAPDSRVFFFGGEMWRRRASEHLDFFHTGKMNNGNISSLYKARERLTHLLIAQRKNEYMAERTDGRQRTEHTKDKRQTGAYAQSKGTKRA